MKAGISKWIIILAVILIGIEVASHDHFMSYGLINPWLILVIGLDLMFLDKAKERTLVYMEKIRERPADKLLSKRIKF